jgi:uncharacterized protein YuzE
LSQHYLAKPVAESGLRLSYDGVGDILYLDFVDEVPDDNVVEVGDGVLASLDEEGRVAGMEVWNFRRRAANGSIPLPLSFESAARVPA